MIRQSWLPPVLCACLCLVPIGCGGSATEKDPDLVTTDSGLQYKDLKVGEGKAADTGDTVEVIYTGRFLSGKQFDSNVGAEALPVTIGRTSVIKGWHEGLTGMKVGGKRKLIIPSDLAYGARGSRDGTIPPNTTLVFEVEVVSLKSGS
jgi:FKBP-type peptidyl-prolyl cis-trans isomerase